MNKTEVINSIILKKRFCKDCNLPIAVFDNPYFYKRLEGFDIHFDCIRKFDEFCKELERFPNEQSFLEYYNELKDTIMSRIKEKEDFVAFNNSEFKKSMPKYPKKELYTEMNDRKYFISIDMKKANFSALHRYSPAIFDNCDTWEEYMRQFTESEHIVNSKYIRQVIMGNCNPKRQTQYEYMIMEELLDAIVKRIPDVKVYSLTTDEIILEVPDIYNFPYEMLNEVFVEDKAKISKNIKTEMFLLRKVKGTDGWMKQKYEIIGNEAYRTNEAEFKCLDAEIYIQVIKHFYALDIEDDDLVFYHNGRLGKFLGKIENPWADEDYFIDENSIDWLKIAKREVD